MDIVQVDSQTIKIKKSGFTFQLCYYYSWDKILRHPESVVLDGNKVNVFFPTSVIRDSIIDQDKGFSVRRYWHIIPAGDISLFFTLDILDYNSIPYLFPCLLSGDRVPRDKIILMGERLSFPSSVFLFPENKSIMISASFPEKTEDQGSISVGNVPVNSGTRLRSEIIYPPQEKLPKHLIKSRGYINGPEENFFSSEGNLKKELEFHILIESSKEIFSIAVDKMHERFADITDKNIVFSKGEVLDIVRTGIEKIISLLVINDQGKSGPKICEESDLISISTTAGLACLLQRFFETDMSMHETSLEYADFVLKAQHPRGIFFEYYSNSLKEWKLNDLFKKTNKGESKKNEEVSLVPVLYSSIIASYLLSFSEILKNKGFFYNKYLMAAQKCIHLFFDQKGRLIDFGSDINLNTMTPEKLSLYSLEFIQPLIKLYRQTEKEIYKKAIKKIKDDYIIDLSPGHLLPVNHSGEQPDIDTALLLLKTGISLLDAGFTVRNMETFIQMIFPWLYFNKSSSSAPFDYIMGMSDSFTKNRLVFNGFECAYYFLKMAVLTEEKKYQKLLFQLAKDILMNTKNVPIGTPWYQHALWDSESSPKTTKGQTGGFNSQSFVRQAWYLLNIMDEFPDMFQ